MSALLVSMELTRIRASTRRMMGTSAVVHALLAASLPLLLKHETAGPEELVDFTWLEPPPEPVPVVTAEPIPAPPAPQETPTPARKKAETPVAPRPPEASARPDAPPKKVENRGDAGRAQARRQVAEQLATVDTQLSTVLADVTSSLNASPQTTTKTAPTGRRRTRTGRDASQLGGVAAAAPRAAEPSGTASRIEGTSIAIESIAVGGDDRAKSSPAQTGGDARSARDSGAGAARSQIRSDAQLLAVVRKYAPGIQFCYDDELKKTPGLGGKLLLSITVAASGRVTAATIVRDSVGSPALARCAIAQIEGWKFPQVSEGAVTFQAPFVFTPPE